MVEPNRPQMTRWRMRIACWIPKATNTHLKHEMLIAMPLQESCTNVTRSVVIRTASVLLA
jgi:hypothetical protein